MTQHHTVPADLDPRIVRSLDAFNAHDVDAMLDEFASGGTFTDPLVDGTLSGTELHEYTIESFQAFPDLRLDVRRVIAATDETVCLETTYVGTHRGSLEDLPATGKEISIPAVSVIDLSEDGITAWRDYFDQRAFEAQLGLTFPAIVPKIPKLAIGKLRASM